MNRIIPILPCPSIKDQVAFYEQLGFKTTNQLNHHSPYAVLSYGAIEMHFYGSKQTLPHENPNMCYVEVDDVDQLYETFTSAYKRANGKIPRSGIPRISKLKDLAEDRRFMITDPGGNTLFVGTRTIHLTESAFYRSLESKEYAKHFETLYDLLYSKEDCLTAFKMLVKFFPEDLSSIEVSQMDRAKILLVALDIYLQRDQMIHQKINDKLLALFHESDLQLPNWKKLHRRYHDILQVE
ncbi:hypothetical protein [Paenibacillus sp. HJGM_3]|uniref:hypothetical protein n=1 Tax=Paenibacillus sp. HJGM_3 TaxID=3379816 RepID=UPI00385FAB85